MIFLIFLAVFIAFQRLKTMYKAKDNSQPSFFDFDQPLGLHMNPENRWIRLADAIPWDRYEEKYARLFRSKTGNVAKPFRMAFGALIIQKKLGFSDRELVEEITENPYLQYFIGLPGYQQKPPFDPSALVAFRKRINLEMISLLNTDFLAQFEKQDRQDDNDHHDKGGGTGDNDGNDDSTSDPSKPDDTPDAVQTAETRNSGTLILDATCAPQNIRFPQDFSLLNEAREDLEAMIRRMCKENGIRMPRTRCREARKNYLNLAKSKRRGEKKVRAVIRKQLGYIRRDMGFIETLTNENGCKLLARESTLLATIDKVYEQQKYMFDNHTHTVKDRIVSITQPFIRPIVRGKAKAPVEFGVKLDLSLDEYGMGRIEKISSNAYNEAEVLEQAVENYRDRTGHYPERVLADQIYRNRKNRSFCKEHGIRLSGPRLGRPVEDPQMRLQDRKIEYQDNTDRIEVERSFSLSKRCYGLGLIRTKLEDTTYGSVALSIFVTNLFKALAKGCGLFFAVFQVLFGIEIYRNFRSEEGFESAEPALLF